MAYLTRDQLDSLNFKSLGENVQISSLASLYNTENIEIGDNSRIDDFCVISGKVSLGSFVHITPMCLIAGGKPGVEIKNYSTLAYGVKVFAQSDDYSGDSMVNSLIPKKFKNENFSAVLIEEHVVIGTNSVVFPGVKVSVGGSFGAMSLINRNTESWSIYIGSPAKKIKNRSKLLLNKLNDFKEEQNDCL
ncbi:acyltransferase [Vibrio cyclitrophicus]